MVTMFHGSENIIKSDLTAKNLSNYSDYFLKMGTS